MEQMICISSTHGKFEDNNQGQSILWGKIHLIDQNVNFTALEFRLNETSTVTDAVVD